MREIELTQGYKAQVDDTDFDWLNQFRWFVMPTKGMLYAARKPWKAPTTIYMHSVILSLPKGLTVDHIDGDGLNDQRNNLRQATRSQQRMNSVGCGASGVKGVSFHKGRWRARIHVDGISKELGGFDTIEEAAAAYAQAAVTFFGEFAFTEMGGADEKIGH